ncbi:MAG: ABC transporter ATP-binding protein [Drouetiella hepatica Uher 2000/2452]|jgi:iron(III) transport system ATP-binding protein|uniref:ABC-type quaternary amine transporter n=1 Tax=Drouetiella hepatica Uher 2000/2452 TaxID=904376 RepID=A0A951Q8S6_9CYAN|nr:ABC transporter ATP-binding protein [Drouetiella hepatica Uher 2000/2452]
MNNPAILRLENVTHQFPQSSTLTVAGITLTLHQGDILALLGPSGCGKTTLLRLIAGFEQPQSGTIHLLGQPVARLGFATPPEKRNIGMVFQDYALFPHLTVAHNIAFGLQQRGGAPQEQLKRVTEALALVGLKGMGDRYPHELSGGQQQRVALARALAPRPALLLLDEPLSNLDVQVRLHLRQEVRDILKATGTSGIFVTHDQEEALAIADQVAVMHQGCLEQWGTPETIYRQPNSRFVAEFVTQANFLPAFQQGEFWQTEIGQFMASQIAVSQVMAGQHGGSAAETGELMIRQEDLKLEPDPAGEVVVRDRQFLGREYCYRLQTASGQQLQARTPDRISIGATVRCHVLDQALDQTLQVFPATSSPPDP